MCGLVEEEIKTDTINADIKSKGWFEEEYKSTLQDIRFLEKTLDKMRAEDESETSFLKKQLNLVTNDKIRLQQHVISLTSRVNNTELDVLEKSNAHLQYDT